MKFSNANATIYINKYNNKYKLILKNNPNNNQLLFNSISELKSFAEKILLFCEKKSEAIVPQNNIDKFVAFAIKEINTAIKEFGTYSWEDKYADELVDMDQLLTEIKKFSPEDFVTALQEILKQSPLYGKNLVATIITSVDNWDQWDKLWADENRKKFLNKFY